MRDKDLVALITIVGFILSFYPYAIVKFIGISILLFFSPGFFLLKIIYHDMNLEELILLSFGVSVGISGAIALLLAVFSILTPMYMFLAIALISILGYFLSSSLDIKKPSIGKPDKFTAVMLSLMLILLGIWVGVESQTTYYKEIDIAINHWPQNATTNSTLQFDIYVKNQNYGDANCSVHFSLNNHMYQFRNFTLDSGEEKMLMFQAVSNKTGKNLASFDLYVNGDYYTNVHIYFVLH